MNKEQEDALFRLCSGDIDKDQFLQTYGIDEPEVPAEVSRLLKRATLERNADEVEFALILGFSFSMPSDSLEIVHQLLLQEWHTKHEDMIRVLQDRADPASVPVLRQAILLKPVLDYLDYDDYGAYYKKCLWALQVIGTREAISVIEECTSSTDPALREQAEYRIGKIQKEG